MSTTYPAPITVLIDEATARLYCLQLQEIADQRLLSFSDRFAKLRTVADRLFQSFTEAESRQFSDFYSRVNFVFDTHGGEQQTRQELHGLRQLANDVIHRGDRVDERQYRLGMKILIQVIYLYSGVEAPKSLREAFEGTRGTLSRAPERQAGEMHSFFRACVLHVGEEEQNTRGSTFRRITFAEAESGREILLACWNNSETTDARTFGRQFADQAGLLWPHAIVHFLNLRKVRDRVDLYSTAGESLMVLEPDYLVDSSELAECFQRGKPDARLFLLSRLVGSSTNPAAFTGRIVNSLLDALMLDPKADLKQVYRECIAGNLLTALQFSQEDIQKIRRDIHKLHYQNLLKTARQYHGEKLRIEPTFFSADYGIQGRLDAMIESEEDTTRKDIFELKSGKCPDYNVWPNHKMQVVGYNLLTRSVFGEDRKGNSSIFYSKAKEEELRNVAVDDWDEQRIIALRNEVVSLVYQLADHQFGILDRMTPEQSAGYPKFKLEPVAELANALAEASSLELAYFRAYLAFLMRELIAAKTGSDDPERNDGNGFASLWLNGLQEKKEQFAIMDGLVFEVSASSSDELTFKRSHDGLSNFREGDIGIIYPQDSEGLRPLHYQILKCKIVQLDNHRVTIQLRNPQVDLQIFGKADYWVLEHDFYETNFNVLTQSLVSFLSASKEKRELILGIRPPRFSHYQVKGDYGLTPMQANQLRRALSAEDYYLLQGPPGTGKTSRLLVSMVSEVLAESDTSLVVLAFTNRAVEEICNKLTARRIDFIRIGGSKKDSDQHLGNLFESKTLGELRKLVKSTRVFVSTVSSFQMRQQDLLNIKTFDTLIVDEASQLIEPQLAGLLARFRRFILIGDQNQLPAVVVQKEKNCQVNHQALHEIGLKDLRQSLFERLYTYWEKSSVRPSEKPIGMLRDHFRMHEDIARLVNPYYNNRLESGKKEQQWQQGIFDRFGGDDLTRRLKQSRTVFIPSGEARSSKTHPEEAQKVASILRSIRRITGPDFNEQTVGVITPWRAQIAEIRRHLSDEPEILDKVTIDTVERFQGSERQIIILSLAVSHPVQMQSLESLNTMGTVDRKLNVAISRAEQHLIMLGHERSLASSRFYREVLEEIRKGGGVVEW